MLASGPQLIALVVCLCGRAATYSTSASAGTNVVTKLNNDVEKATEDIHKGVTAVSDPLLRLAVDTLPPHLDLIRLYGLANGVNMRCPVAALARDILGKAAVAGGSLAGNAAVLGSSVARDVAEMGGAALDSKFKLMETAAEAAIKVADAAVEQLIEAGVLSADLTSSGLSTLGDGMQVAGVSADVVSLGVARLLQTLGARLAASLESAGKVLATLSASGTSSLTAGAQQLTGVARDQLSTALDNYLSLLSHVQAMFDNMAAVIAGSSTSSATVTATAA